MDPSDTFYNIHINLSFKTERDNSTYLLMNMAVDCYLFLIYLETVSVAQTTWFQTVGYAIINKLKSMWKVAAVTEFRVLSWHLPEETGENN
jgi:hypothetical protein